MNVNAREFRPTSRASAPVTPARGSTPVPASGAAPPQAGLDRKASGAGYPEGEPACQPVGCVVRLRVSLLPPCVDSKRLWGARALGTRPNVPARQKWQALPVALPLPSCVSCTDAGGARHTRAVVTQAPHSNAALQGTQPSCCLQGRAVRNLCIACAACT